MHGFYIQTLAKENSHMKCKTGFVIFLIAIDVRS